jgi:hypothetical protein
MASRTRVAVIYATVSGVLRRKIVPLPGEDDNVLAAHPPGPGESVLYLPIDQPYDDHACHQAIAAGHPTIRSVIEIPSGLCNIVDGAGRVVGSCMADPALDAAPVPGTRLVPA